MQVAKKLREGSGLIVTANHLTKPSRLFEQPGG
jgi:hypothetical protein